MSNEINKKRRDLEKQRDEKLNKLRKRNWQNIDNIWRWFNDQMRQLDREEKGQ